MEGVVSAAAEHGAAGTILPLVSTVIRVDGDGFLAESLDRSLYRGSQTPQVRARGLFTSPPLTMCALDYVRALV